MSGHTSGDGRGIPPVSRRSFLAVPLLAALARRQDADPLRWQGVVQQRAPVTGAHNEETIKAIERRLKCTCGCNLDIFTCRTTDFTCTYSPELHKEVVALSEAGRTPDAVVAAFVERYGEQILMAPRPVGFNLAGYLVPGLAVLVAAVVLAMVLLRRQRKALAAPAADPAGPELPAVPPTPAEQERLRRALSEVAD